MTIATNRISPIYFKAENGDGCVCRCIINKEE